MTTKILLTGVLAMAFVACSPPSAEKTAAAMAATQPQKTLAEEETQELAAADTVTKTGDTKDHAQDSSSDKPLFESPNYHIGGKIKPGRYACQEMPGMQLKSLSEMGSFQRSTTRWTSQFDITANGSYTYRGSTPKAGEYSYNQESGTITWNTGPYSSEPGEEDTITGIYTSRKSDDHPVILLVFRSPAYGESCEYCALVPAE